MELISRTEIEDTWELLAAGKFAEADLRDVPVDNAIFKALHLPRDETFKPKLAWRTGLSIVAMPRFAAYCHRLVLLPADVFVGNQRSKISQRDIEDLIIWSGHMQHVITVSTFKSGASHPFTFHAQSFPLRRKKDGWCLSALPGVPTKIEIKKGEMPHFDSVQIEQLSNYPICGLRITGDLSEVTKKTYELALNYDDLKAFNLVIVPSDESAPAVYFFPRNKDGNAIYQTANRRWQIAALEVNGLMQAKTETDAAQIDAARIKDIFARAGLPPEEFKTFLNLLNTF